MLAKMTPLVDVSSMLKPLVEKKPKSNKRARPESDAADEHAMRRKKSVRWSTVTVYEFGVAIGGSAVPRRGGPSIGLSKKPQTVWSATVDAVESDAASSDDSDSASERRETKRRVRWFKPQERVQLLTKAGCSEKRIYRTMMETSEIAMSRRLCIAVNRDVAV